MADVAGYNVVSFITIARIAAVPMLSSAAAARPDESSLDDHSLVGFLLYTHHAFMDLLRFFSLKNISACCTFLHYVGVISGTDIGVKQLWWCCWCILFIEASRLTAVQIW